MSERYGDQWAIQRPEQVWLEYVEKCKADGIEYMLETELDDGA